MVDVTVVGGVTDVIVGVGVCTFPLLPDEPPDEPLDDEPVDDFLPPPAFVDDVRPLDAIIFSPTLNRIMLDRQT